MNFCSFSRNEFDFKGSKSKKEGNLRNLFKNTRNTEDGLTGDPSHPLQLLVNILCILLRVDCHARLINNKLTMQL